MAFLLYRTSFSGQATDYKLVGNFKMGGGGLVQQVCRRHLRQGINGGWTLSREEMLRALEVSPDDHEMVIDTSPRRPTANLFEIKSISGFSYSDWTPIMVRFESLFVDDAVVEGDVSSVEEFKKAFSDVGCPRDTIRTVLYLRGGHTSGDWNFGGNSRTTAALLWDDAWAFFSHVPTG